MPKKAVYIVNVGDFLDPPQGPQLIEPGIVSRAVAEAFDDADFERRVVQDVVQVSGVPGLVAMQDEMVAGREIGNELGKFQPFRIGNA